MDFHPKPKKKAYRKFLFTSAFPQKNNFQKNTIHIVYTTKEGLFRNIN